MPDKENHSLATPEAMKKAIDIETKSYELLKKSDLLDILVNEVQMKVVGEKETIETILIVSYVRKVKNAKRTSSNLLLNDESGVGKDHTTKSVLDLMPKDEIVYRTKITQELLTYWHNTAKEPEWTWDGKVFYIEDIPTDIINSDVFKVFSSGGSKATVLIKQKPVDIEVNGKPAMIVTSYGSELSHENLRRYPVCFLDDSEEQTLKIMERQSIEDETGESEEYDPIIINAMKLIKSVKVVIPFARKLPKYFPKNRIMRTHYKRFLDYIKSSACLYQYQRKKDDSGNVVAEWKDYDIARDVLLKTTSNPGMIPLTKSIYDFLKYFEKNPNDWYTVGDLEDKFPYSERTLQGWVKKLFKNGFLVCINVKKEGVNRTVPSYSYNTKIAVKFPTSDEILKESKQTDSAPIDNENNNRNNREMIIATSDKGNSSNNTPQGQSVDNRDNCIEILRSEVTSPDIKQCSTVINTVGTVVTADTLVTVKAGNTFVDLPLQDKIDRLKDFIRSNKNKFNYEELTRYFPQNFIDICLEKKIVFKLPDGKISWCPENLLKVFDGYNKSYEKSGNEKGEVKNEKES